MIIKSRWLAAFSLLLLGTVFAPPVHAATAEKDWTFMVYISAVNDLDPFVLENILEMQKIGTSDRINIVIEWGSLAGKSAQRALIVHAPEATSLSSPVLEDLGQIDMGDWHNVVDFASWSIRNFPARHYFVTVSGHGSGWHGFVPRKRAQNRIGSLLFDIGFDDVSDNQIRTVELGRALSEISGLIGHKIDIYGSDACQMAMAEIASEVSDSVHYFVGSEDNEPDPGWPYFEMLKRWTAAPDLDAAAISKLLVSQYAVRFSAAPDAVTLSALDLDGTEAFQAATARLGAAISELDADSMEKVRAALAKAHDSGTPDYRDLLDFTRLLRKGRVPIASPILDEVDSAARRWIIASETHGAPTAQGFTFWLPTDLKLVESYLPEYRELKFSASTHWEKALESIWR